MKEMSTRQKLGWGGSTPSDPPHVVGLGVRRQAGRLSSDLQSDDERHQNEKKTKGKSKKFPENARTADKLKQEVLKFLLKIFAKYQVWQLICWQLTVRRKLGHLKFVGEVDLAINQLAVI